MRPVSAHSPAPPSEFLHHTHSWLGSSHTQAAFPEGRREEVKALDLGIHGLGSHLVLGGYELLVPNPDSDSALQPFLGKWQWDSVASRGTQVSPWSEMGLGHP